MNFYWIYGVIGVMLLAMLMLNTSEGGREIQWTEFKQKIEDGQVKRLVFDGQRASVYLKDEVRQSLEEGQEEEGLLKTVYQGADYWLNVPAGDGTEPEDYVRVVRLHLRLRAGQRWGQQMLTYVVFFALMIGVWILLMRRLGGGGGGGAKFLTLANPRRSYLRKAKARSQLQRRRRIGRGQRRTGRNCCVPQGTGKVHQPRCQNS